MQLSNTLLTIHRLQEHLEKHYEIKDPSVVQIANGRYMMYASIGNSITQTWLVGRFIADHPSAPWQELEPATFSNLSGPQLCAPAVTYQITGDQPQWDMYIQTACFEENGAIVYATSSDGQHFVGHSQPVVTRMDVIETDHPVVGVYDVGISEVKLQDQELLCMLYSGYRKVGCGDIYASYKSKSDHDALWSKGQRLLSQEGVPFHNHPDYENFEWGLEGAKLIQLAKDCFVIIGVCFMPKPAGSSGTRQRVFMAAATSIHGPFQPLGLPFAPIYNTVQTGENGHPDTVVEGNTLWIIYQERTGEGQPWHLRNAAFSLPALEQFIRERLTQHTSSLSLLSPESYHFSYPHESA